ncbi:MAG: PspC domain-containing protein [Gordonibacter sp.]|uniref:PspC domain-containing protein n=1 Tax=Gordonibacter sp. TaxID=1968902 RepID=UPI002FC5E32B
MNTEKRLYRSRHALVGGVCGGMADYFNTDPLVVRILVVALSVLSAGLFAVAYVALWVVLPQEPECDRPLDVEPQSACSDTYGRMNHEDVRGKADGASCSPYGAAPRSPHEPYVGSGHVPPEPPAAAAWAYQAKRDMPPTYMPPTYASPQQPPVAPAAAPVAAPQAPEAPRHRSGGVRAAIIVGALLLFFGVAALLRDSVEGVSWWQFWPLVLVIVGMVDLVVPAESGHRMERFVNGLMLFCLGGTLLFMSLDIVSWSTIRVMLENLWPLLLMMVGLFVIGSALRSWWWTLAAGLCFVAFCVAGLGWYAVPGSTEALVLTFPPGREYVLPLAIHLI